METKQYKSIPFEIKAEDAEAGTFSGYGACFHNIDSDGDIIVPGAFKDAIPEFLERGVIAWQHNWDMPIGKPTSAEEDGKGLLVSGAISDTTAGRDARILMRDRVVKTLSIGYSANASAKLMDEQAVRDHWASMGYSPTQTDLERMQRLCRQPNDDEYAYRRGVRILKRIYPLYEISPVSVPANQNATITDAKNAEPGSPPADLPFSEHSKSVLAAVTELLARARSIHDLRAEKGRSLSKERREDIKTLADQLAAFYRDTEPLADPEDVLRAYAQYQSTVARLNGALKE